MFVSIGSLKFITRYCHRNQLRKGYWLFHAGAYRITEKFFSACLRILGCDIQFIIDKEVVPKKYIFKLGKLYLSS